MLYHHVLNSKEMVKKEKNDSTDPNAIFRQAFDLCEEKQEYFAIRVGATQPQVSKYLNKKLVPPSKIIIQCMHIIHTLEELPASCRSTSVLARRIKKLNGDKHKAIRKALTMMVDAYETSTGE